MDSNRLDVDDGIFQGDGYADLPVEPLHSSDPFLEVQEPDGNNQT